jgi:nucleoid DNA-binding protein
MDLEARAEHEIELIEQDETLTNNERQEAINDVIQELKEALRDQENCW